MIIRYNVFYNPEKNKGINLHTKQVLECRLQTSIHFRKVWFHFEITPHKIHFDSLDPIPKRSETKLSDGYMIFQARFTFVWWCHDMENVFSILNVVVAD